nr:hypothetical protein [Tanacetum cinerariifolium]
MIRNRALLTNFVEKFFGTVRFGNNDFAVIAGYGDVVIRTMTIKKVYYVEGLGHNLFSVGQFCYKGLEIAFRNLESGLSNLNKTGKSSNPSVSQVLETSEKDLEDLFQKIYDEYFDASKIMKSSTTNVETFIVEIPSHEEEVFHESSELFQDESSSSSLNDDVQQSPEETAFLNGIIKEEVYVGQPLGFVSKQYPDHVYALDKVLLQVNQFSNRIFINQSKYIIDILKRFGMENCDTVPTPMVEQAKLKFDLVGKPVDHTDYRTVKRIFCYLNGTINLGLWYPKDSGFDLTAYSDANHAGCHLDRKTESEYVVVSSCCAQVLWMRTQLTDYGFFYDKVPIYCDSKSAIAISCNPVQQTRTKHIDVRKSVFTMIENFQRSNFSSSYNIGEDDEKQKREIYETKQKERIEKLYT